MGASIIRGRQLAKQIHREDDRTWCEIIPIDGDYAFYPYSTVEAVIAFSEQVDARREMWPVYYGVNRIDLPLDRIHEQCTSLRDCLCKPLKWYLKQLRRRGLAAEPVRARLFSEVHDWFAAGQVFVILE